MVTRYRKRKKINKKGLLISLALLLIIIIGLLISRNIRKNTNQTPSVNNPVTQTVPASTAQGKPLSSKGSSSSGSVQKSAAQIVPGSSLIRPYGSFVSNHYPSLTGVGAPSQEESVCTSNPGVSCYIEFTKAGVTKKLPTQITGEDGSTVWEWDVKKGGFTIGDWLITAVVTSGSSSKSRQDSIMLTVSK